MSHPRGRAASCPDAVAINVFPSGESRTYAQLIDAVARGAALFADLGMKPGDVVGIFMSNRAAFSEVAWAAHDAGLYDVCVPAKATVSETAHYLSDSGSKVLVCDPDTLTVAERVFAARGELAVHLETILVADPAVTDDGRSWAAALARSHPFAHPVGRAGTHIYYSSGTTGKPKQIRPALPERPATEGDMFGDAARELFDMTSDTVYLSPAPLYHTAPLAYCMAVQQIGGEVVLMQAFDPEHLLMLIERHRVTHVQLVPTMFSRLLKLPEAVRRRYDLSSLTMAIHAAAPCPPDVKHEMINWWGPILVEYYGGSEGNGMCLITSSEWLLKPGSVGRANWGTVHIATEGGEPARTGESGLVYFSGAGTFEYYGDADKTAGSRHPMHPDWSTLGDIGHLDEDGYLFLTDRRDFVIISGGVNIYPREIEDRLILHPAVADVAVVGGFDADFGERVIAVVEPLDAGAVGPELTEDLLAWCRLTLSPVKCPRRVIFETVPRTESGKLRKGELKRRFARENEVT